MIVKIILRCLHNSAVIQDDTLSPLTYPFSPNGLQPFSSSPLVMPHSLSFSTQQVPHRLNISSTPPCVSIALLTSYTIQQNPVKPKSLNEHHRKSMEKIAIGR